jgi:hypothetical protein
MEEMQDAPPNMEQSSPIATFSVSEGDASINNAVNVVGGLGGNKEVNQVAVDFQNMLQVGGFVNQIPNMGVGLLNILQAYDSGSEDDQEGEQLNDRDFLNEDDFFNINELVPPEEAHLQLGMVRTFFSMPRNNETHLQNVSPQGMLVWEKFFAPHI